MSTVTTRAKFRVNSVEYWGHPNDEDTPRTYHFSAVHDSDTEENRRYSKWTPYGELTIKVDNPAVRFEHGELYYLDFTKAER